MKNSTAANCITLIRPIRSASRPAIIAPSAAPSSAMATTVPSVPEATPNLPLMPSTAPLMTAES